MEEEMKAPDKGAISAENAARAAESSANETAKPDIPIARNANPAGVSTARTVGDLPLGGTGRESDAESPQTEYPIARNANPTGVSTSRTRD